MWQLVDSAFPSGGFAHSNGMESAWAWGLIDAGEELTTYLQTVLRQAADALLPFCTAVAHDPGRFREADWACDATMPNHIANQASRAQGQAMLKAGCSIYGGSILLDAQQAVRLEHTHGHLAPVFGLCASSLGFARRDAGSMFLYTTLRATLSAAVRLGIVGPMEAQRLQRGLAEPAHTVAGDAYHHGIDETCQTAPLLDLAQTGQDRLYSRLFQS